MTPITICELTDIVSSQICLHGNQALFVKAGVELFDSFQLFSGSSVEHPILDCFNYQDRCTDEGSLESLLSKLVHLDQNDIVYCSDDAQVAKGFQIGFRSTCDGFIETINSKELAQPTFVEGE
jgi:hypothetical protein